MDGFLVRRFVREYEHAIQNASVERLVFVPHGFLLVLVSQDTVLELGLAGHPGAAWAWCFDTGTRARVVAELGNDHPDLVTPEPLLGWKDQKATPLDALRAWMLRPESGHPGWHALAGTRVLQIQPCGRDRILELVFEDSTGALLQLRCELFDRSANFLLTAKPESVIANWVGRPARSLRTDPKPENEDIGLSLETRVLLDLSQHAGALFSGQERRRLARRESQLVRLAKKLNEENESAQAGDRWTELGQLLAANQHRIKRGQSQVTVQDFHDENKSREIELEPGLTPQENVARFFRHAKRAKRAQAILPGRLAECQATLDVVRKERQRLPDESSWSDLLHVFPTAWARAVPAKTPRTALGKLWTPGGPAWKIGARPKSPAPSTGPGRLFVLPGDWEVRVGRSNADNDELTHRYAHPNDVWLHASGVSGSHVVLRMQGRQDNPPREVLVQAAALAARFSKAKHAGTVPVVWTRKRYVRKPRGSKPGTAACTREQVLFVTPARH